MCLIYGLNFKLKKNWMVIAHVVLELLSLSLPAGKKAPTQA